MATGSILLVMFIVYFVINLRSKPIKHKQRICRECNNPMDNKQINICTKCIDKSFIY